MVESHVWSERLDLGHEAMDHEHHLQIALVSAIAEAVEQARPWMARRLAEQLVAYSEVHFGSEELLMEAMGFREGATHAGEHEALRGRMREIASLLEDEQTDAALAAALELRERIAGHVATADRRLAEATASR